MTDPNVLRMNNALTDAVSQGLLTADEAALGAEEVKLFSFLQWFPELTYEEGNPVALLQSPVSSGVLEDVHKWLASTADKDQRVLYINSPGGSAVAGVAIYNALKRAKNVATLSQGTAYSAASVIFQGGTDRVVLTGATVGIHRAYALFQGNAEAMRNYAKSLDAMDESIMNIYMARADRKNEEAILDYVMKDTMLPGKDAVAMGLADRVVDEDPYAHLPLPGSVSAAEKEREEDVEAKQEGGISAMQFIV